MKSDTSVFKKDITQTYRTSKYSVSFREAPGSNIDRKARQPDNLAVAFSLPHAKETKQNRSTTVQVTFSQNNNSLLLLY
jgi:hypothetical protein